MSAGNIAARGKLKFNVYKAKKDETLSHVKRDSHLQRDFSPLKLFIDTFPTNLWKLKNWPNILRGWHKIALASVLRIPTHYGILKLKVFRADGSIVDYGIISTRVVTNAGANFIVDAFQSDATIDGIHNLNYHGLGTGITAEAATQTDLVTELTNQYQVNNIRATGVQEEGASTNVYRTSGTNTVDANVAVTEHGIFSVADVGSGTLLDRSVFAVVNLTSGDSLETQYNLTITSGG